MKFKRVRRSLLCEGIVKNFGKRARGGFAKCFCGAAASVTVSIMMAVVMVFSAASAMLLPVLNVKAENYTYTVTISAGNKGEIQDTGVQLVSKTASMSVRDGKIVITGLAYRDMINVSYADVVRVTDEQYYAKVLRESGRDNGTANVSSITVTDDRDYIIGYGIKGDQVAYTVNYVDENGVALGESNTYYGNVGDRPVVAYRYFEGYMPQAYNLTKTLVSNEAENVFTFTYREMTPEEIIEYVTVPAQPGPGTEGGGDGETTTTPAGPGGGGAGGGVGGAGADGNGGEDPVDVPEPNVPEDLIDLDEPETPTSNLDLDGEDASKPIRDNRNPMPLYIGIGIAAVIGLIVVLFLLLKKKEKRS